jgi:hypothetical protein
MNRSADQVDDIVMSAMPKLLRDPTLAERIAAPSPDTTALREEVKRLRLQRKQIEKDYDDPDNEMPYAFFMRKMDKNEEKLTVVNDKLADAGSGGSVVTELLKKADPGQAWLDADLATQQAAIRALVTVTIHPSDRTKMPFDDKAIKIEPTKLARASQ